jgi:hypothetical protein
MERIQALPIVSDLPLSTRSDREVLQAIEIEIRGLRKMKAAIDEAAAELQAKEGSRKDTGIRAAPRA